MKTIISILFLVSFFSYSQDSDSLYPNFKGQTFESLVNNTKWSILKQVTGDLDNSAFNYLALILESKDSIFEKRCSDCKARKIKSRIVLILIDNKVIIQNNKFIARSDEGGMAPYLEPELSIKKNLLTILYHYTRDHQSYTFKLKNNTMNIVEAKNMGIHSASGNFEYNEYNFQKNVLTITTGNISEENEKIQKVEINVNPKTLSTFKEMYKWKVLENKFL